MARTKRAILVGFGHAHLYAAKHAGDFAKRGFEVVVVAPDEFWYSGLATGMLGGQYPPNLDRIAPDKLLAGNGRFLRDEMVGLDLVERKLLLRRQPPMRFDVLSIDVGSAPPAIPGSSPQLYSVKPIRRLLDLRRELERRVAAGANRPIRVAIVGGGVTAFEVAANADQLIRDRGGRSDVVVYVSRLEVLTQLPPDAATAVVDLLTARGVRIRINSQVERIDGNVLLLSDGSSAPFDYAVNATGLRPVPLLRSFGLPINGEGALIVDQTLMSVGASGVFGGGDCIAFHCCLLPRVGVYAIRQGPILHHNLLAHLEGRPLQEFRPQRRYLSIMTLGAGRGLAVRGRLWWRGRTAFWLKDIIDRRFLRRMTAPSTRA